MEELTIKNPWLGLESYKEGEVLYGRDDDIRDLSQCVLNDIDTLFYGKSGIGKSSILNAGIIPAARRHGYLPVLVRLSHKEKLTYLYQIKDSIANAMIPIPLDEYGNLIKLTIKEQQQRDAELKKRVSSKTMLMICLSHYILLPLQHERYKTRIAERNTPRSVS